MQNHSFLRSIHPFDFDQREWRYIIPHPDGFLVHLTEDCAILFRDLVDMNGDTYKTNEDFKAKKDWESSDWQARISKERTHRAFHDGDVTCFFDSVHLTEIAAFFKNNSHTATLIEIHLCGEEVTPEELDDDMFEMFMQLAERFGFEYCLSYSKNADIFKELADDYRRKAARLQPLSEQQLYSVPLRRKGVVKGLSFSAAGVAAASLAVHAGHLIAKAPDWRLKVLGSIIVGVATAAGYLFGQQSAVVAKHAYTNPILSEGGGDIIYES